MQDQKKRRERLSGFAKRNIDAELWNETALSAVLQDRSAQIMRDSQYLFAWCNYTDNFLHSRHCSLFMNADRP
jgi:hypothetical protein